MTSTLPSNLCLEYRAVGFSPYLLSDLSFSFPLKTIRIADFLANDPRWTRSCFKDEGGKGRSPVNHSSISAQCGGHACAGAADSRLHSSRARNNHLRPHSRAAASYTSRRFVPAQPEGHGWEAVQEMFLASRPRFVALAYSILRNKEDAEDAVQDAFLSAYLHLRAFEGRSAFTTWFTRIVLNAALMIRRKRKHPWIDSQRESSTSTDETPWTERIPAAQPDPEMMYAEEETLQLIDVLLGRMSPLLRQAFTMTYHQEMSNEEAGALLGVTTGTFKSRLFRARRHLLNQASRLLLAPIRRAMDSTYPSGESAFQALAPRFAESLPPEIAFL
jgi:RNA polymerase sigma-70 factor (ECF subfamily)